MSLFRWRPSANPKIESNADRSTKAVLMLNGEQDRRTEQPMQQVGSRSTCRNHLYSVRVGEGFKGEVLELLAQLQLERCGTQAKTYKVTGGELMELMLDTYKAARRNGELAGHAVPIPDDVWYALHLIARQLGMSASDVFEQMVIDKAVSLGVVRR